MSLRILSACLALSALPPAVAAQSWNTAEVRGLVERAVARRSTVQADSGLRTFRARAHGFVFFLGQLGEGFSEPPRLIKSDQLALEVYWQAPGLSKQIILGRRDRLDLPTDVQYHRDHLGIVQNNFGDQIRLGDGDEVKDVPHPLGGEGPALYDYALTDSLSIQLPDRTVRVYQVLVRPRDFGAVRLVGTLFIDVDTAELVRFRFSFTPSAYLDDTLEDITVVLDNGLWFGRYWLPRRQEIEIRRRSSFLDIPARGIIRGRWEIGSYEFNVDVPPGTFRVGEPEIVYAPRATRDSFDWQGRLDAAIDSSLGPVQRADLDAVRSELAGAVAHRALTGLPSSRPGFGSMSDLLHVNRVEGIAPGFGLVRRIAGRKVELSTWASYGFSDHRFKYRAGIEIPLGRAMVGLRARREVVDIGDWPVNSRVANSFLAQERGYDFGDYVLLHEYAARLRTGGPAGSFAFAAGYADPVDAPTRATPSSGSYRPNAPLGGAPYGFVRAEAGRQVRGLDARVSAEGGIGDTPFARARAEVEMAARAGNSELVFSAFGGWGSRDLPPHRAFVLGGLGSLPGEPFRAWGGRQVWLGRLDVRVPVPFVPLPLGAFGSTGNRALAGPFLAAGWTGGQVTGAPWRPSDAIRVVAGVQLEMFHRLVRAELGIGLRDRRLGFSIDLRRDLWPIL